MECTYETTCPACNTQFRTPDTHQIDGTALCGLCFDALTRRRIGPRYGPPAASSASSRMVLDLTQDDDDDDDDSSAFDSDGYEHADDDEFDAGEMFLRRRLEALVPGTLVRLIDENTATVAAVLDTSNSTLFARPLLTQESSGAWSAAPVREWRLSVVDIENVSRREDNRLTATNVRLEPRSQELRALQRELSGVEGFEFSSGWRNRDGTSVLASALHPMGNLGPALLVDVYQLQSSTPPLLMAFEQHVLVRQPLHQLRVFTSDASVWRDIVDAVTKERVFRVTLDSNGEYIERIVPEMRQPYTLHDDKDFSIMVSEPGLSNLQRVRHTIADASMAGEGLFAYESEVFHVWSWLDEATHALRIVHFHVVINSQRVPFTVHVVDDRPPPGSSRAPETALPAWRMEQVVARVREEQRLDDGFLAIVFNNALVGIYYLVPGERTRNVQVIYINHELPAPDTLVKIERDGQTLYGRVLSLPSGIDPDTNELLPDDVRCPRSRSLDLCPSVGPKISADLPGLVQVAWIAAQNGNSITLADRTTSAASSSSSAASSSSSASSSALAAAAGLSSSSSTATSFSWAEMSCVSACGLEVVAEKDPVRAMIQALLDSEIAEAASIKIREAERVLGRLKTLNNDNSYTPTDEDISEARRGSRLLDAAAADDLTRLNERDEQLHERIRRVQQDFQRLMRSMSAIMRTGAKRASDGDSPAPKRVANSIALR